MSFGSPDFSLLEKIANEFDLLAEQGTDFHKKLIEIYPTIQELIIRVNKVEPDTADTVRQQYERLLRITNPQNSPDPHYVKIWLHAFKKGLCRISQVLKDEYIEDIKQVDIARLSAEALQKYEDAVKKRRGEDGQGSGKEGDKEQKTPEADITTLNNERRIELIDDFSNWTDKLIDYIKRPDKNREIYNTPQKLGA